MLRLAAACAALGGVLALDIAVPVDGNDFLVSLRDDTWGLRLLEEAEVLLRMDAVRAGDLLRTADGGAARVRCVVVTECEGGRAELVALPGSGASLSAAVALSSSLSSASSVSPASSPSLT